MPERHAVPMGIAAPTTFRPRSRRTIHEGCVIAVPGEEPSEHQPPIGITLGRRSRTWGMAGGSGSTRIHEETGIAIDIATVGRASRRSPAANGKAEGSIWIPSIGSWPGRHGPRLNPRRSGGQHLSSSSTRPGVGGNRTTSSARVRLVLTVVRAVVARLITSGSDTDARSTFHGSRSRSTTSIPAF